MIGGEEDTVGVGGHHHRTVEVPGVGRTEEGVHPRRHRTNAIGIATGIETVGVIEWVTEMGIVGEVVETGTGGVATTEEETMVGVVATTETEIGTVIATESIEETEAKEVLIPGLLMSVGGLGQGQGASLPPPVLQRNLAPPRSD